MDKNEKDRKRRKTDMPSGTGIVFSTSSLFDPLEQGHGRLFSQYFSQVGGIPKIDMVDNGDSFTISADMPGVDKKDIKLKVTQNSVSISATRSQERETSTKNYYSHERSSTGYFRTVSLPEEIKSETAKAKYENGTLRIDVKKARPGKPERDVKIE